MSFCSLHCLHLIWKWVRWDLWDPSQKKPKKDFQRPSRTSYLARPKASIRRREPEGESHRRGPTTARPVAAAVRGDTRTQPLILPFHSQHSQLNGGLSPPFQFQRPDDDNTTVTQKRRWPSSNRRLPKATMARPRHRSRQHKAATPTMGRSKKRRRSMVSLLLTLP